MTEIKLTIKIEKAKEGGYISYVEELEGINSQGKTLKEATLNILDAYKVFNETNDLKENNSYYTPKLEEFHRGFRYEIQNVETVGWEKVVEAGEFMETNHCEDISEAIDTEIRVKYLNDVDLKELGWKKEIVENEISGGEYWLNSNGIFMLYKNGKIGHNYTIDNWKRPEKECSIVFKGKIKNYNELKKLMQMLKN